MPAFKPEQRHLVVRGRSFHFVSYEGRPANPRRGEEPEPAMWYLMVEGRRFPAFPCDPTQQAPQVDAALERWAVLNAMEPKRPVAAPAPPPKSVHSKHRRTWWGPG
jgi:hypothetical protein